MSRAFGPGSFAYRDCSRERSIRDATGRVHKDDAVTPGITTAKWRSQLVRITPVRYLVLALMGAAAGVVGGGRGDWDVFVTAGKAMLGPDGMSVYARFPDVQTGPFSLLIARVLSITPRDGFVVSTILCVGLGLFAIRCLERAQHPGRTTDPQGTHMTVLLGGLVVMFWWAKLGGYGHLDDAIVLTAAAAAVLKIRQGKSIVAAVLIGLAIATKPWAVILVPLTFVPVGPLWQRLRAPLIANAIGALFWLPFFVAEPHTLESMRPTVNIAPDSVLQLFGVTNESLPTWMRSAQLLGALGLATFAIWRGRVGGVLLVAVAFRMMTDPGTWSYYTAGLMLGALAWDLYETTSVAPTAMLAAAVLLLPPWLIPWPDVRAATRLVTCLAAIVLVAADKPRLARRIPDVVAAPG